MPKIEIKSLSQHSPELGEAAQLFDQYRQFYGTPSQIQVCTQFLINRLTRQESIVLFATVDGQTAGFTQLYRSFSSIACRNTMILNDLFVREEHRTSGVGKQLIQEALRTAKDGDCEYIQLETAQENAGAQRLYERIGFKRSTEYFSYSMSLST